MLGQSHTEGILRERLAELGVKVEFGAGLVGFTQDDDGVTATSTTGETVRATWLVGADGGAAPSARRSACRSRASPTRASGCCSATSPPTGSTASTSTGSASEPDPRTGIVLSPLPGTDQFQFGAPLGGEPTLDRAAGARRPLHRRGCGCTTSPGARSGGPTCGSPSGSGSAGCSSRATPPTCTRRPAARASTPACRTPTTSAGSSPTARQRCWTPTRPSGAPSPRPCWASPRGS